MLYSSGGVIYGSKDPLFGEEEHRQIMVNDQCRLPSFRMLIMRWKPAARVNRSTSYLVSPSSIQTR
ncbi:hypothetical protein M3650_15700 [Paenibacillus sp. MER TA 81-3]|uniref:hypothetical protein n=1 Tax=Paenibacillus sp. MER TA 81-3 TaxID=2939573 RepID=UPI00203EFA76|nr:hypothetical protein [Paenibacillus sp. MER TA 81-3]MCM3340038.1 hypothetical protein [Paenibacillus sp. MER TA 81-3]